MIKIKWIDVTKEKKSNFKYDNSYSKINNIKDKKLTYASNFLKSKRKSKYFSITHCYPICVLAEGDEPLGIDIENTNRKIDWKNIVKKKFPSTDYLPRSRDEFFLIWTTREAYFKCTQDKKYLSIPHDEIISKYDIWHKNADDYIFTVCSSSIDGDFDDTIVSMSDNLD